MFQKIWQWFMNLFSKSSKKEEGPWGETAWVTPSPKVESGPVESGTASLKQQAEKKRAKRRIRNMNHLTKGAFGKPKIKRRERE